MFTEGGKMFNEFGFSEETKIDKKKEQRKKKLAALKKKIKSGKYKVDSSVLAEALSEKLKI